jgi:hypothetical protein
MSGLDEQIGALADGLCNFKCIEIARQSAGRIANLKVGVPGVLQGNGAGS